MYYTDIKNDGHNWRKTNTVTIIRKGKSFDEVVCENCGIKGRRYSFESVAVPKRYNVKNAHFCPKPIIRAIPKTIKVVFCQAVGFQFNKLIPDSIHSVVTPPDGYKNDHTGLWVMGVSEPVKLLTGEFIPEEL